MHDEDVQEGSYDQVRSAKLREEISEATELYSVVVFLVGLIAAQDPKDIIQTQRLRLDLLLEPLLHLADVSAEARWLFHFLIVIFFVDWNMLSDEHRPDHGYSILIIQLSLEANEVPVNGIEVDLVEAMRMYLTRVVDDHKSSPEASLDIYIATLDGHLF